MQLTRLINRRPRADDKRDASDDFWYGRGTPAVAAGVNVTIDRALTLPVVYDCLQVLSQTVGSLPYGVFERERDGSKTRRSEHPLMDVLADPNPETTDVEFMGQLVFDLATDGNAFIEIRMDDVEISELWRHDPQMVTVERAADGFKRYRVRLANGVDRIFTDRDMWHVKAFSQNGMRGLSPIHAGREAIGAALALQDYSARFFNNDCTPPFILEHAGNFKDEESKKNFLSAIKRWWGGRNRSPGILEYGIKLQKVGVNNEEAQFLQTRKELDFTLARLWRMPPHKVGLLDKATFSNIESQALEFVTDTLLPWLRLIEKSINKHLVLNAKRFFFEFNVAGLLRGDVKARFEAYAQGRQWGWLSVNEIRKLENMNPVEGGDVRLQPLNMVPLGTATAQPAGETSRGATLPRDPDHFIFDPGGRAASRIFNGFDVRLEEHRRAA